MTPTGRPCCTRVAACALQPSHARLRHSAGVLRVNAKRSLSRTRDARGEPWDLCSTLASFVYGQGDRVYSPSVDDLTSQDEPCRRAFCTAIRRTLTPFLAASTMDGCRNSTVDRADPAMILFGDSWMMEDSRVYHACGPDLFHHWTGGARCDCGSAVPRRVRSFYRWMKCTGSLPSFVRTDRLPPSRLFKQRECSRTL